MLPDSAAGGHRATGSAARGDGTARAPMPPPLRCIVLVLAALAAAAVAADSGEREPIIDVHLHAYGSDAFAQPVANPVTGQMSGIGSEAEHRQATLAAMRRYNIVRGYVSNDNCPLEVLRRWRAADSQRIVATPYFEGTPGSPLPDVAMLRSEYQAGWLGAMGEIGAQYGGLSPADPKLEAYFALAEELDLPVGIHTGLAAAGTPYRCCPEFRVTLGNPRLLEEVLVRHPKLRLYIMHGGWPYLEDTKAIMNMYPQVYADLAVIDWIIPRDEFHDYLRALLRAGFGRRLMFGSDQMLWPEAIGMAIEGIDSAPFLTAEQKRDIFYNNAARFLRLGDERYDVVPSPASGRSASCCASYRQ
ncbi:MAG: amidohydrolase [Gammaproteobacteria bacterium]|nr:amidohydrolase [Gammaproteobacteria bacterium]